MRTLEERLLSHIDKTDGGCWLWTASTYFGGYGQINVGNRQIRGVHRVAYELWVGPIPDGLHIDHLCRVRLCVNPDHLEAVTQRENNRRSLSPTALNAAKTHCPQGHPYVDGNLAVDKRGFRHCRTCNRANCKERYWARKALAEA
jgi:hypothetical protein